MRPPVQPKIASSSATVACGRRGWRLLGHDGRPAIANVLFADADRIAAAQTGIKQHSQPDALFAADRPPRLTNVAAHEMEIDIRLGARTCERLAGLRFRVAEIAAPVPQQNGAATARDLREALDNAARMPSPTPP
jgi:prepilin-type processing-associated H-X9-DG protein